MKINKNLLVFAVLCWMQITAFAQLQPREIDQLVEETMETFNVPGMAVAVVKDGEVVHQKGYGVQSLQTKKNVDTKTLFGVASNTKAFTTAALAQLIDQEKLSWDTPVTDIIPEFKLYDSYTTREFTVRDLVTHRGGLGLGMGDLMVLPATNTTDLEEMIHNLRYLKPTSSFRSTYNYNNLLYIVAGEVVSRVADQDFEEYITTHFFEPLAMKRATMDFAEIENDKNRIDGHAPVNDKLQITPGTFTEIGKPAAGIYASIEDMTKWAQARIDYGKYGENKKDSLFSKQQAQEMWTPQTITRGVTGGDYNTHFSAYGMGWALKDINGKLEASHTGGLFGIVSQFTLIPEEKLGIIVLTNQESGAAFMAITNSIKDAYFGIEDKNRVEEYAALVEKSQEKAKAKVDEVEKILKQHKNSDGTGIENIEGTFQDDWYGKVELKNKENQLRFISDKSPEMKGDLHFYKGTTYVVKWDNPSMNANAFVNFDLDTEGKAKGFTMKAVSPLTDFSFDFQDLHFKRKE